MRPGCLIATTRASARLVAGATARVTARVMAHVVACTLPAGLLALAGCSPPSPATGYFPLEQGHQWTYDQTTEWENNRLEHETIELRNLGSSSDLDSGKAWRRRSASGVDYWLRSDSSGIYRVASKSDLDEAPKPDAQPRFVLKMPLAEGTSWQASTTAYLLRRRQEFPPEIRHSHPAIPMTYTIAALGETLKTRAGEFKDCIRVQGNAQLKLFADPVVGWREMPLTTTEWYCNGVGLVRLERNEPAQSTFLSGGKLSMELVAWE